MFKKAIQIIVTFSLLVGMYHAYMLAFGAVANRIGRERGLNSFAIPTEAELSVLARKLAEESFGPGHWATKKDLRICLYDAERGFFMYAGNYKRLEEGKKLEFWPFAIVWLAKDGKSRKTATSERAKVELREPMGLTKPGGSSPHIVEARLIDNVWLRDDKGTRPDRSDDLVISGPDGGMPYIEYTEKTNPPEIRTVSNIKLVDQNLTLTGYNLLIYLRKDEGPGAAAGFEAKTVFLQQDIRINIKDVGKSGGNMFGSPRPTTTSGPTPLVLRDDGLMRIDLPRKPRALPPTVEGPPESEGPTYATFHRNVEVERGRIDPDVLNCPEALALTLLPVEKVVLITPRAIGPLGLLGLAHHLPGAGGAYPHSAKESTDGPLGDLDLRIARGTGYAVWINSVAQHLKARCNELIYKKATDGSATTTTYLRADRTKHVDVEKEDHDGIAPDLGPIKSVTTIRAADVVILDDGQGNSASTVIARGPGSYEERADRDRSVDHSATWNDEMVTVTLPLDPAVIAAAKAKGEEPPKPRRLITLTGDPVMTDHSKDTKIEAAEWIKITMKPRAAAKPGEAPPAVAAAPAVPGDTLGSGSSQIEWVHARRNVRLTTPGKIVRARQVLDAPFEEVVATAAAPAPAPVANGAPAAAHAPAPVVPVPALAANAPPAPAPAAKPEEDPRKAEPGPNTLIQADRIWAKILQIPGGKSELSEARLRGGVLVDQDGTVEKPGGTHLTSEAMDVRAVGKGLMKFKESDTDPSALAGDTRLAARDGVRVPRRPYATVLTDDYYIEGPNIGLDQSTDFAWVIGPGRLVQLSERGFLTDKGLKQRRIALAKMTPEERKKEDAKKKPMTIVWNEKMLFTGRSKDPDGNPSGKAEFFGHAVATTEESRVCGEKITTWTDRPVSLVPRKGSRAKDALADNRGGFDPVVRTAANPDDVPAKVEPEEPKPELALVEVESRTPWVAGDINTGVQVVSTRYDDLSGDFVEKQYLEGNKVIYDKRTGNYHLPGAGIVRIWKRQTVEDASSTRSALRPVAGRPRDADVDADATKPAKPPVYGPIWELTKVRFKDEMRGRFGLGKDEEDPETRTADFYGAVQAVNGKLYDDDEVRDRKRALAVGKDISFDTWQPGSKYLTSDMLRLVDVPPTRAEKAKGAQARQYLTAEDDVQARDDTHNISADILTYDSLKGQFWAFGKEGKLPSLTEQKMIGQTASLTRGTAFRYNSKDGSFENINPSQITLYDGQGLRPSPAALPAGPAGKIPKVRPPLRPPPRTHNERKDFRGS